MGGDRANRQRAPAGIVHHDLEPFVYAGVEAAHTSMEGEPARGTAVAVAVADRAGRDGRRERQGPDHQGGCE
jgi:hypothetical protein